jgi:hypothetical protein
LTFNLIVDAFNFQALKMEIQLKESKLHNLEMELEEASQSGGSSEQVNALRKAKNDFQMKAKELVSFAESIVLVSNV